MRSVLSSDQSCSKDVFLVSESERLMHAVEIEEREGDLYPASGTYFQKNKKQF